MKPSAPLLLLKRQQGLGILYLTLILLLLVTMITLYIAAMVSNGQETVAANYRSRQAFEAAEAGVAYGVAYFIKNQSGILTESSFTSPNLPKMTLAPTNSSFQVTYTLPIAGNYNIIKISAQGWSDDGTATRTITQLVGQSAGILKPFTYPLTAKASVTLSGNASVSNPNPKGNTIQSGSSVSMSGNSHTLVNGNTSTSAHGKNGGDVLVNSTALANSTNDALFASVFTKNRAAVKASARYVFSTSNPNLNGLTDAIIWVDGSVSLSGNTSLGSPTQPVILIINGGSLNLSGNNSLYGFVYVTNNNGSGVSSVAISGNSKIIGGLVVEGTYSASGNSTNIVNENTNLYATFSSGSGQFAMLPGSWSDF